MSDLMMTRFQAAQPTAGRPGARHLVPALRLMLRAYQTRHDLMKLGPRERADIGVSLTASLAEAARVPWDVDAGPIQPTAGLMGMAQRALERARTRRLIRRLGVADRGLS